MHRDSDGEDTRLLEEGRIAVLLAKYDPAIVGRCIARLHGSSDAEDVAQDIRLRLLAEFHRGRRYRVPYRVVVHQVVGWTLRDHFAGRPTDVALREGWEPAVEDESPAIVSQDYLERLFDPLPARQREVLELRYLEGLERDEIAERLGMSANAVDQALHNGHAKVRDVLIHG